MQPYADSRVAIPLLIMFGLLAGVLLHRVSPFGDLDDDDLFIWERPGPLGVPIDKVIKEL